MLQQLKSYIAGNRLLEATDAVLAAVSGGVDSMTLLHLLPAAGYRVGAAHCNFQLRGEESDGDEGLVREYCNKQSIPLFVARFDTQRYAAENGISIQMAARELRYAWFEQVAAAQGFDKIAIAHNANDEVETFFLNLARGTGLRGLSGMAAAQGRIVRPLLFAPRANIAQYAREHDLRFREDSSNGQVKYARNRIRIEVIPELTKVNPAFLSTMRGNMERLGAAQRLVEGLTDSLRKKACTKTGSALHIKISALPEDQRECWLFELLYEYGFSGATVSDVAAALGGNSGKIFYSPTHALLKNRDTLIVTPRKKAAMPANAPTTEESMRPDSQRHEVLLPEDGLAARKVELGGMVFSFEALNSLNIPLNQGNRVALLDYDALQFPLKLRPWRAGDRFVPLGMAGEKKLSDFFIDVKLNLFEKHTQLLLCSANGDIAWVVGQRIDNRYRVTEKTTRILVVRV
ncbi:MAG: tRNA lysidine(34) synthetase TilS [Prevotellaceae bacterium]|nr:tRNA lysidine(34) synthetase TilS [Prevotellaceae bacterium]